MDAIIYLPTAILSAVLLLIYAYLCYFHGKKANVAVVLHTVLEANAVVGGCVVILSTIVPDFVKDADGIKIYVFVGGVAVLFLAAQAIRRSLSSVKDSND